MITKFMTRYNGIKTTHIIALAMLAVLFLPATAMADCTDPAGKEGEVTFNDDYLAFQGCNGTDWVAFHDPSCADGDGCIVDPCETGPFGTMCNSDNAIYAGTTVGGVRLYAARCDVGMSWDGSSCTGTSDLVEWKTSNSATTNTDSATDGIANTDAMATAGLANHPAAEDCRDMGANWYLPARDELEELYTNLADTGVTPGDSFDFTTSGPGNRQYYWSSTQGTSDNKDAWYRAMSSNFEFEAPKSSFSMSVRCVRR